VDQARVPGNVTIGRVLAVNIGERTRRYQPEVRVLDVEDRRTSDRFSIRIDAGDRQFVISLPPGNYVLNRVQIAEGPFMSMAELAMPFSVGKGPVSYVGTWRFGVGSPGYGRMVAVSIVSDQQEMTQTLNFLHEAYPVLAQQPVEEIRVEPPLASVRLFEVMPYPRVHRYFRRHWW
jgi:hypothetical protein